MIFSNAIVLSISTVQHSRSLKKGTVGFLIFWGFFSFFFFFFFKFQRCVKYEKNLLKILMRNFRNKQIQNKFHLQFYGFVPDLESKTEHHFSFFSGIDWATTKNHHKLSNSQAPYHKPGVLFEMTHYNCNQIQLWLKSEMLHSDLQTCFLFCSSILSSTRFISQNCVACQAKYLGSIFGRGKLYDLNH